LNGRKSAPLPSQPDPSWLRKVFGRSRRAVAQLAPEHERKSPHFWVYTVGGFALALGFGIYGICFSPPTLTEITSAINKKGDEIMGRIPLPSVSSPATPAPLQRPSTAANPDQSAPRPATPLVSTPAPPLANTTAVDTRLAELLAWSKHGFNSTTKAQVPIAAIAPDGEDPNHYLDRNAVQNLSSSLSGDLHLVPLEDAALVIKVTDSYAKAHDIAQPCIYPYSTYIGTASMTIQMIWVGRKTLLFPQAVPGSGESCGDEKAASNNALNDAAANARKVILALSEKKAAGTANH
jgi:hypothetical protein